MRVALVSPPWFPVPPTGYGGIEAVVHLLAEGLVAAGAKVTLFASGDSTTQAELVAVHERAPSDDIGRTQPELIHVLACAERIDAFDLVHDHSGPLGATVLGMLGTRVVHTVHGTLTADAPLYRSLCRVARGVRVASLSLAQRAPLPGLPWVANLPNGIDVSRYSPARQRDGYLLFLGRMSPDKGAHRAVAVARAAGRPLKIAAKCREPEEQAYFAREVEPLLGPDVEWLGEVGHEEKARLLRHAHALVFPIDWEEPFGLVMVEALASGTPVAATNRGSVPEVLEDGRTGVVVDDWRELPRALERVSGLDPAELRREAERRFSAQAMVDRHLQLYEQLSSARTRAERLRRAARGSPPQRTAFPRPASA